MYKRIIHTYVLISHENDDAMNTYHYITIAIAHILYCCLLSYYRDASVLPFRVLVDVILQHPFCTRL